MKTKPTSQAEVFKQPIFSNPLVTNVVSRTLGVNGINEWQTIAKAGTYGIGRIGNGKASRHLG